MNQKAKKNPEISTEDRPDSNRISGTDTVIKPSMSYYPVALDVREKQCLVVGGGSVGARKALTLAKCGAAVTVVSPEFSDEFIKRAGKSALFEESSQSSDQTYENSDENPDKVSCRSGNSGVNTIKCIKKPYDMDDLDSVFLVIGATDNMDINRRIAEDAKKRNILCNIADFPEGSSFVLPSIVQRGDLVITVSTSGKSPALAKKLRKDLEEQFGEEYESFLMLMGKIRKELLSMGHSPDTHASIFRQLVYSDLLEMIRINEYDEAGRIIRRIAGDIPGIDNTVFYSGKHGS